jgi:hypothetical protein
LFVIEWTPPSAEPGWGRRAVDESRGLRVRFLAAYFPDERLAFLLEWGSRTIPFDTEPGRPGEAPEGRALEYIAAFGSSSAATFRAIPRYLFESEAERLLAIEHAAEGLLVWRTGHPSLEARHGPWAVRGAFDKTARTYTPDDFRPGSTEPQTAIGPTITTASRGKH